MKKEGYLLNENSLIIKMIKNGEKRQIINGKIYNLRYVAGGGVCVRINTIKEGGQ
jgi:hypothetical protein